MSALFRDIFFFFLRINILIYLFLNATQSILTKFYTTFWKITRRKTLRIKFPLFLSGISCNNATNLGRIKVHLCEKNESKGQTYKKIKEDFGEEKKRERPQMYDQIPTICNVQLCSD